MLKDYDANRTLYTIYHKATASRTFVIEKICVETTGIK
jgi:hypothetical protein